MVQAHRGVDTYGRGTQLLVGAAKKLEGAIKALQGTQMLSEWCLIRQCCLLVSAAGRSC